ncbi:class I SAM-dependent methyltransferase [Nonomuraea antimicrobica]|uniref:Class I SAM-dependent methyltransferase n=1 Tax=Nonomuraea antimicrobica TaxID=561173 RepID=A0ABP7CNG2_9ACTN
MTYAPLAAAYDAVAARYAECIPGRYHETPLHHAMIPAFAAMVLAGGGGPVADAGCGPGHVTAHLSALGVDAFGVDVSPEMVARARADHPGLRFEVGLMGALDVPAAALAGVVANHSIIHTPPELLPETFAEFGRVLASGGLLLLGFPGYEGPEGLAEPFDHMAYPAHRYALDGVAGLLLEAGFAEVARLVVAPGEDARRGFPTAYLLARRTTG